MALAIGDNFPQRSSWIFEFADCTQGSKALDLYSLLGFRTPIQGGVHHSLHQKSGGS
jgi:hypothetical protein